MNRMPEAHLIISKFLTQVFGIPEKEREEDKKVCQELMAEHFPEKLKQNKFRENEAQAYIV